MPGTGLGIAAGLALLITGCGRAVEPPPVCVAAAHGRVFAETVEQAAALVPELDRDWQAVRELVPGCRDVPVDVWIVRELNDAQSDVDFTDVDAFANRDPPRIVLRATEDETTRVAVHELVHVLTDDTWSTLPAFVAEGLANYAASRLAPGSEGSMADVISLLSRLPGVRLRLVSTTPDAPATCTMVFGDKMLDEAGLRALLERRTTHTAADYVDVAAGYSVGFVLVSRVVERHGLQGLRALCEAARAAGQAQVSPDTLLEAAELPTDPAGWWSLIVPSLGDAELRTMAHRFAQIVAVSALRGLPGTGEEIAARVASGLVELRVGAVSVRLGDMPEVMQELRKALPAASESAHPAPEDG